MNINLLDLQAELDTYNDDAVVKNRSRIIVHDDEHIYIYLCRSGTLEYATYSPDLFHFLTRPSRCSFSYDYKKERSQVELMQFPKIDGKRYKPFISSFLYQWYMHKDHGEGFFASLREKTRSADVDHVNGDKHNHCTWNLLDSFGGNRRKNNLPLRVKPPYYLHIVATPEKEYRIEFGYENNFYHGQTIYLLCENIDDLIHFLFSIMNLETPPVWIRRNGTPKQVYNTNPRGICKCECFKSATHTAERLLSADPSLFIPYTQKNSIEVYGGLIYITG